MFGIDTAGCSLERVPIEFELRDKLLVIANSIPVRDVVHN